MEDIEAEDNLHPEYKCVDLNVMRLDKWKFKYYSKGMKELMNMRDRFTASSGLLPKSNPFYEDLPWDEEVDYLGLSEEVKGWENNLLKRNSISVDEKLKDLSAYFGQTPL